AATEVADSATSKARDLTPSELELHGQQQGATADVERLPCEAQLRVEIHLPARIPILAADERRRAQRKANPAEEQRTGLRPLIHEAVAEDRAVAEVEELARFAVAPAVECHAGTDVRLKPE